MISYLTAKTFPQRLELNQESITEIVSGPINAMGQSDLLKDDQDMLDIIVEFAPANISVELARELTKLQDIFQSLVEEDALLTSKLREATSRVGTIRSASDEEEEEVKVKTLQEMAKEALSGNKK